MTKDAKQPFMMLRIPLNGDNDLAAVNGLPAKLISHSVDEVASSYSSPPTRTITLTYAVQITGDVSLFKKLNESLYSNPTGTRVNTIAKIQYANRS